MPARSSNIGFDWIDFGNQSFSVNNHGGPGDDLLVGDNNGDIFTGKGGNDTFIGGTGDDLFRDGPGQDVIVGGGGFDRLSFGFYTTWAHGAFVDLGTGLIVDGNGNVEQETGISAVGGGTFFGDTFVGGSTPNLFWGGKADVLIGGHGDDVFLVDEAPSLVLGGTGVNTLWMSGQRWLPPSPPTPFDTLPPDVATHGVVVDLGQGMILDDGFGGSGAVANIQNLYGTALNDVLVGDKGDNVIWGGGGDDTMTGGGGQDVFLFDTKAFDINGNPVSNGHDVITDFRHGDKIAINMPGIASLADLTIGENAKGDVVITYDANQDTITLLHVHHITAADFIFGPV